jgi:hypothetical protein
MPGINLNVGMLGATCALCATEVAVDSPAYENVVAASVCAICAGFGIYLSYHNVKIAVAKTKGPIKGRIKTARQNLPTN